MAKKKEPTKEWMVCRVDWEKVEDLQRFAEAVRALSETDRARLEGFVAHATLTAEREKQKAEQKPMSA